MKLFIAILALALSASGAVRSSSASTGTTTTRICTVPAGVATDDIILIMSDVDGNLNNTGTLPSGFTAILTNSQITADGQAWTVGWKRATGADSGSYTWGASNLSADWTCIVLVLSGRHTTNNPVAGTVNTVNTAAASPITVSANGVTAVAGDDLVWLGEADPTATGVVTGYTPPSGYTEQQDARVGWTAESMATKENVSAGATGTVSGTLTLSANTAGYGAILIRVPSAPSTATVRHRSIIY